MSQEQNAFESLCAYTLGLHDPEFVHQHVVDAFAVQRSDAETTPICITFALIGLYLLVEKHFNGRQVQRVHMRLAKGPRAWPRFFLPENRGSMTATEVLSSPEGPQRIRAIHAWCTAVWTAFIDNRETVVELLRAYDLA